MLSASLTLLFSNPCTSTAFYLSPEDQYTLHRFSQYPVADFTMMFTLVVVGVHSYLLELDTRSPKKQSRKNAQKMAIKQQFLDE